MTYRAPEKLKTIAFRATDKFEKMLDDCVKLWKLHAEARGDDVKSIDRSYLIRALLEEGVDKSFAEYGGRPLTPEAWEKVETAITNAVKK